MPKPQTITAIESNEYIGMVCHELKTPLTLLNAIVQLLDKKIGNGNDQSICKSIAKANEQVKKMGDLINSFLNGSSMDICLVSRRFKLNHLMGEIAEQLRCMSANHRIILDGHENIFILADREKVGCVLSNIICNAIKYSPNGKYIYVKCFRSGNNAIMRVRDEGMGIEPKYMDQIFEKRFRIEEGNAGKIGGSGIGLYLSAVIIEKHGGSIWAESVIGKGSIFSFSLPVE